MHLAILAIFIIVALYATAPKSEQRRFALTIVGGFFIGFFGIVFLLFYAAVRYGH